MRPLRAGILIGAGSVTAVLLACNGGGGPLTTIDDWDDHPGSFEKPTGDLEHALNSNDPAKTAGENPGPQGGGGGSCFVSAGKYKLHYTLDPSSGQGCKTPSDDTITIDQSGDPTLLASQNPEQGCTITANRGACSVTISCTSTKNQQTQTLTETISFGGGNVSGTASTTSGSLTCKYSFVGSAVEQTSSSGSTGGTSGSSTGSSGTAPPPTVIDASVPKG